MTQRNPCEDQVCCNRTEEDICCIDTNRIYDSSRCQNCIEGLRLYLTDCGQAILENCSNLRIKEVRVLWTQIETEDLPFNTGYFQVNIRYYFYVVCTCCHGSTPQELQGLAIYDQSTILFGGEGHVSIFRSDIHGGSCHIPDLNNVIAGSNMPRVVVEVAEPVPLACNVVESCNCAPVHVPADSIPPQIACLFNGSFTECACVSKVAFVSIGIFALIRIERPAQLIIPACDFCIPDCDKSPICMTDPCSLFNSIPFPINEFYPSMCGTQNN